MLLRHTLTVGPVRGRLRLAVDDNMLLVRSLRHDRATDDRAIAAAVHMVYSCAWVWGFGVCVCVLKGRGRIFPRWVSYPGLRV